MTQEPYESRPVDLTDVGVQRLATGQSAQVGEQVRPRAVSDAQVEALAAGKAVDLESLPDLQPVTGLQPARVAEELESRPRVVSDKDVEALSMGKDIGLEKRDHLKSQIDD